MAIGSSQNYLFLSPPTTIWGSQQYRFTVHPCHQMVRQDHFSPPTLSQELSWDNILLMCPHSGIICWSSWAHLPCDREMASQGNGFIVKVQGPSYTLWTPNCQDHRLKCHCRSPYQIDDSAPTHTIVWQCIFIPDLILLHKTTRFHASLLSLWVDTTRGFELV